MKKQLRFVDEVENELDRFPLIGKTLQDIYFFDNDPFLNKDHMTSIFNNTMHYGAIVAKTIRRKDIPDEVEITRGRGNYKGRFVLAFSDGTALQFLLNGKRSVHKPIPFENVSLPERKNNINEHKLFSPVFGRTICEFKVWITNGNFQDIIIEISFREGLMLRLTDFGIYIMRENNHPLTVTIGRYRKMIRGYSDLFDDKLELYPNDHSAEELIAKGLYEQQITGYKLEQLFFKMTGDVKFVYELMSHLKTHEERREMLEFIEQKTDLTLLEVVMAARHIADLREK